MYKFRKIIFDMFLKKSGKMGLFSSFLNFRFAKIMRWPKFSKKRFYVSNCNQATQFCITVGSKQEKLSQKIQITRSAGLEPALPEGI